MRELGLVVAIVALMCVASGMWLAPWETLYEGGIWVTAAGFVLGVPTGLVYHVLLYRALQPRGQLPRGWYWRPLRFNALLQNGERASVMAWCYAGAFGFAVICVGLLMMGSGVSLALIRGV
ncbi:MAG: hypothetical protein PVH21_16420 [Myxococcales bacterium]|jgi:hypothetical protein